MKNQLEFVCTCVLQMTGVEVKVFIQRISMSQNTWEELGEEEEEEEEPSAVCGAVVGVWPQGVRSRQRQQTRSGGLTSPDLIQSAGHQARDSIWAPFLRTNK